MPDKVEDAQFATIAVGSGRSCGVKKDDTALCWYDEWITKPPTEALAKTTFKALAGGYEHVCGVRTDGKLVCWGSNRRGQAPRGPTAELYKDVVVGDTHSCGLRRDGKVVCWGQVRRQKDNGSVAAVPPASVRIDAP